MWNGLWVFGSVIVGIAGLCLLGFLCVLISDMFRIRGIRYFSSGAIKTYLKSCAVPKKHYGIFITRWKTSAHSYGVWGFYYDTENALVLTVRMRAVACLGFDVDEGRGAVYVKQIQGKKGMERFLYFLKWERFLLNHVVLWAKDAGYRKVFVLEAEKNKWYNHSGLNTQELAESQKRFKMRYNTTAKRIGFRYNAECGYYVKDLVTDTVIPQASS